MNFDGSFLKIYFIVGAVALLYFIFFRGGFARKEQASKLSSKQFLLATQRDVADPTVALVDLRSAKSFRMGSIPHSTNIDISRNSMKSNMDSLPRNKTYYIYCQSGEKSPAYATYMINSGFRHVYYLESGFDEWLRLGYPVHTENIGEIVRSNP